MLTSTQVEYLARIANLRTHIHDRTIIGLNNKTSREDCIKVPYEEFKQNMGLDDIRLHWLLSDKCFMAGGAVLNWVWGEDKNEDIDFFFTNEDSAHNFKAFISNYGFEETTHTTYAFTFFHQEEKLIVQVVGNTKDNVSSMNAPRKGFIPFGTPDETISRFDIVICKFAVDCDNVYFEVGALMDLISKNIRTVGKKNNTEHTLQRIIKYSRKGLFTPDGDTGLI